MKLEREPALLEKQEKDKEEARRIHLLQQQARNEVAAKRAAREEAHEALTLSAGEIVRQQPREAEVLKTLQHRAGELFRGLIPLAYYAEDLGPTVHVGARPNF